MESTLAFLLPGACILILVVLMAFGIVKQVRQVRPVSTLQRLGEVGRLRVAVDPRRPGDRRILLETHDSGWGEDHWFTADEAEAVGLLLTKAGAAAAKGRRWEASGSSCASPSRSSWPCSRTATSRTDPGRPGT